MDGQESVTKSAVSELLDAMNIRGGVDYFSMGAVKYRDMLGRVIDAPTDADGNLLHVGDEVRPKEEPYTFEIQYFVFNGAWGARTFGISLPCSDLHRVAPDSRERIEADAAMYSPEASDLVRRCFALVDGEHQ